MYTTNGEKDILKMIPKLEAADVLEQKNTTGQACAL